MVVLEVADTLGLTSLTKDDQVSAQQMIHSCLRLVSDVRHLGVAITGLRLRVSHYYSVMNSGELVIPWDWKGDPD